MAGTKPATTPARAPGIAPRSAPTGPCTVSPIVTPTTVRATTTRTVDSVSILHPTLVQIHAVLYRPPPIRPDSHLRWTTRHQGRLDFRQARWIDMAISALAE